MLLADLLPGYSETRPTRPTTKKLVGRHESLVPQRMFDTSDTSDTKSCEISPPGEEGNSLTIFTQVDTKNPLSVRHLPIGGGKASSPALAGNQIRKCASSCCGGYVVRQPWESEASWSNKRYCSASCYGGQPVFPAMVDTVNERGEFCMLAFLERWGAVLTLEGGTINADLSGMKDEHDRDGARRILANEHICKMIVGTLKYRAKVDAYENNR